MMKLNSKLTVLVGLVAASMSGYAGAQSTTMSAEKAERCATRLSIAFLGKSPTAAMMSNVDPQAGVDQLIASADFVERFARFVNATYNDDPGETSQADSSYHLTKYILNNNRPWEEMFIGPYKVDVTSATNPAVIVTNDPNGLGYFRSRPWLVRYAGNEEAGIKISTAYRMMNNTVGLKLVASTNAPGADLTATGRQAAGCRACHYDSWFALDKTASVLTKRVGTDAATMTFAAPTVGAQPLLGGITVSNDKELVTALVKSEAFRFRTCRLAFEFLYGRPEATCEGPVFDACMQEFAAKGTIQSALSVVAKNAAYCQ
jgi:hypothetical protein